MDDASVGTTSGSSVCSIAVERRGRRWEGDASRVGGSRRKGGGFGRQSTRERRPRALPYSRTKFRPLVKTIFVRYVRQRRFFFPPHFSFFQKIFRLRVCVYACERRIYEYSETESFERLPSEAR